MNDADLLRDYLELASPELGGEWNLSAECAFVQWRIRDAVRASLEAFDGIDVLNVGIGVGEWDDFLGYWLKERGSLTSVDIGEDRCIRLRYRQQRQGHPNPSKVVCENILRTSLPAASFDVITAVGSTIQEIGDNRGFLEVCMRLLRPGGRLLAVPLDRNGVVESFLDEVSDLGTLVVHDETSEYGSVRLRTLCVQRP